MTHNYFGAPYTPAVRSMNWAPFLPGVRSAVSPEPRPARQYGNLLPRGAACGPLDPIVAHATEASKGTASSAVTEHHARLLRTRGMI